MVDKIKNINPIVAQLVIRNLGLYASERLSVDVYYLIEAVNLLISDVGEDWVKIEMEKQGKDWNKMKENLDRLNKLVNNIKVFYDAISDKKFEKKEENEVKVQLMFKSYFRKTAKKISLLQRPLYDLFVFLIENTSVGRMTIPNEAFKVLEHTGMRKIELDKARRNLVREGE